MNRIKEEKALRLYEAIGELDQMMVNSALHYKKRSGISTAKLTVIIAACMAVFMAFAMVGAYMNGLFEPQVELDALETLLDEESGKEHRIDASDIDYFSGEAEIIWYDGENYYMKTLGKTSELSGLQTYVGQGEQVDSDENREYRVWISCGDGRVISPYLESSAGNVGYCELFDYDPEISPSDGFVNYIDGLLN